MLLDPEDIKLLNESKAHIDVQIDGLMAQIKLDDGVFPILKCVSLVLTRILNDNPKVTIVDLMEVIMQIYMTSDSRDNLTEEEINMIKKRFVEEE